MAFLMNGIRRLQIPFSPSSSPCSILSCLEGPLLLPGPALSSPSFSSLAVTFLPSLTGARSRSPIAMLRSFLGCLLLALLPCFPIWSLPIKLALSKTVTPLMLPWLFVISLVTLLTRLPLLTRILPPPLWTVRWFSLIKRKPTTGSPTLTFLLSLPNLVFPLSFNTHLLLLTPHLCFLHGRWSSGWSGYGCLRGPPGRPPCSSPVQPGFRASVSCSPQAAPGYSSPLGDVYHRCLCRRRSHWHHSLGWSCSHHHAERILSRFQQPHQLRQVKVHATFHQRS